MAASWCRRRKLRDWKPTNPSGYRRLFEGRAGLQPRIRQRAPPSTHKHADVAPFPATVTGWSILRRTVQLLKRHRDIYFLTVTEEVAPISIVVTTLAARSYEYCVGMFTFDTEFDVLLATIRMMPHFIERRTVEGRVVSWVPNEASQGRTSPTAGTPSPPGSRLSSTGTPRRSRTSRGSLPCMGSTASP
jgi:hypothetical protein